MDSPPNRSEDLRDDQSELGTALSFGMCAYVEMSQLVHEHCPVLQDLLQEAYDTAVYFSQVELPSNRGGWHLSVPIIMNQALNDYMELLRSTETGDGRSAIRSARSLVEHAVNLAAVTSDQDLAERYLDHLKILPSIAGNLALVSESLRGKNRRSDTHARMKMARGSGETVRELTDRYTSKFIRQWHPENFRTRLATLDWREDYYDFYRFSSLVLHGAASGSTGSMRSIDGGRTFRLGPSLELVPEALLYGVGAFGHLLEAYIGYRGESGATSAISAANADLQHNWHKICAGLQSLDDELWPKSAPIDTYLVAGVDGMGSRRWFVAHAERDMIASLPSPPELNQETIDAIDSFSDGLGPICVPAGGLDARRFKLATIALYGISVRVQENAVWNRSSTLFGPTGRADFAIAWEAEGPRVITRSEIKSYDRGEIARLGPGSSGLKAGSGPPE